MIVLHELGRDPSVGKRSLVVAFEEIAARVAEYTRFDQQDVG
jgi:hypothetical protein